MSDRSTLGREVIEDGPDLVLRPLRRGDRERLLDWRNRPEVARYMYSDHTIGESEHDAWLAAALKDPRRRYWIIELERRPVGLVGLYGIDRRAERCFWAFYLADPAVRGRGVGRRVEAAVLRYVFEELRLEWLYCEVLAGNRPVIRLHESMGFERDALLVRHVRKSDGWHDVVRLRQSRARWKAAQAETPRTLRASDGATAGPGKSG